MADLAALSAVVGGARCWGIELDPQYRVLAVTIEPDPLRTPGTAGEHQLLCFPTSVLLVAVTRPITDQEGARTSLLTFELDQLTAVSERFAGTSIGETPFGNPEPRPGSWGPRYSLEGRSSAPDGTRATLMLDLATEDGSRLRLFARFDDAELRDGARTLVMGTSEQASSLPFAAPDATPGAVPAQGDRSGAPADAPDVPDPRDGLRFPAE